MLRFFANLHCPRCRGLSVDRIKRQDWMRLLPMTKQYVCCDCDSRFITILGKLIWWRKWGQ